MTGTCYHRISGNIIFCAELPSPLPDLDEGGQAVEKVIVRRWIKDSIKRTPCGDEPSRSNPAPFRPLTEGFNASAANTAEGYVVSFPLDSEPLEAGIIDTYETNLTLKRPRRSSSPPVQSAATAQAVSGSPARNDSPTPSDDERTRSSSPPTPPRKNRYAWIHRDDSRKPASKAPPRAPLVPQQQQVRVPSAQDPCKMVRYTRGGAPSFSASSSSSTRPAPTVSTSAKDPAPAKKVPPRQTQQAAFGPAAASSSSSSAAQQQAQAGPSQEQGAPRSASSLRDERRARALLAFEQTADSQPSPMASVSMSFPPRSPPRRGPTAMLAANAATSSSSSMMPRQPDPGPSAQRQQHQQPRGFGIPSTPAPQPPRSLPAPSAPAVQWTAAQQGRPAASLKKPAPAADAGSSQPARSADGAASGGFGALLTTGSWCPPPVLEQLSLHRRAPTAVPAATAAPASPKRAHDAMDAAAAPEPTGAAPAATSQAEAAAVVPLPTPPPSTAATRSTTSPSRSAASPTPAPSAHTQQDAADAAAMPPPAKRAKSSGGRQAQQPSAGPSLAASRPKRTRKPPQGSRDTPWTAQELLKQRAEAAAAAAAAPASSSSASSGSGSGTTAPQPAQSSTAAPAAAPAAPSSPRSTRRSRSESEDQEDAVASGPSSSRRSRLDAAEEDEPAPAAQSRSRSRSESEHGDEAGSPARSKRTRVEDADEEGVSDEVLALVAACQQQQQQDVDAGAGLQEVEGAEGQGEEAASADASSADLGDGPAAELAEKEAARQAAIATLSELDPDDLLELPPPETRRPLPPAASTNRAHVQRGQHAAAAQLIKKLRHDRYSLHGKCVALKKMRTKALVASTRLDKGPQIPRDATWAEVQAIFRARMETPEFKLVVAELQIHIVMVKRCIGERIEEALRSAIDLKKWVRGVSDYHLAVFFALLMKSLGTIYCRNDAQFAAMLVYREDLVAFDCDERGVYSIEYPFREEMAEKEGIYGGGAFDQFVSSRAWQHDDIFKGVDVAFSKGFHDKVQALQRHQRELYKANVSMGKRKHTVVATSAPPAGSRMSLNGMPDAAYLRLVFAFVTGEPIDKYMPRGFGDEHVVKMVNALHEHVVCATLNCLRGGYPLVVLLYGARYPHRGHMERLNTALPCVSFKDANLERAPTPASLAPPLQRANAAVDRANYLTPEPTQASAIAKLRDAERIADLCDAQKQPPAESQVHASISSTPVNVVPYIDEEEVPARPTFVPGMDWARFVEEEGGEDVDIRDDTGSIVSSVRSSVQRQRQSVAARTCALIPKLTTAQRRAATKALTYPGEENEGWAWHTEDGKIVVEAPYDLVGELELGQEYIQPQPIPDGAQGRFFLEPCSRQPAFHGQPMAAAPGLSYIMQTYQLVFKYDNAQRRRFEPMAAAIGYDWNDLGESLAEIVTVAHPTNSPKGRLIAESFQSDPLGQLLNHIGVRLRQGGSRQPITRAQDGSRWLKMPKGAASLAGKGGEDEEVLVKVDAEIPAGHDLILFVNESDAAGDYHRVDYITAPRDGSIPLPAGRRQHLQDVVEPWVHEIFLACVAGLRGTELLDDPTQPQPAGTAASSSSAAA